MKLTVVAVLVFLTLLTSGCPKSAPDLDLGDKATKERAVRLMRDEVFVDAYGQYECWANGRMVVPRYKQLVAGDAEVGQRGKRVGDWAYSHYTCDPLSGMLPQEAQNKAKEVRNRVFYDGQGIIDEIYFKYASNLRSDRSKVSFLADIVDIGLGGSIGLTKGSARTIRDLGIILTGFRAGRDSGRLRFYNNQTTEVILDQMDASRGEVFLNFRDTDSKKNISEYPIESVFSDLFKYFAVGSQTEAFKRIRRRTATNADVAEAKILRLEKIDPARIFTPSAQLVVNMGQFGPIKDAFVTEINAIDALAAGDPTKAARSTALNDKLKAIFSELTAGVRKDEFAPYFTAVRAQAGTHYSATYANFLTSGTSKAEMDNKIDLLAEVKTQIFQDYSPTNSPKREVAESLLLEITRLFAANKLS